MMARCREVDSPLRRDFTTVLSCLWGEIESCSQKVRQNKNPGPKTGVLQQS